MQWFRAVTCVALASSSSLALAGAPQKAPVAVTAADRTSGLADFVDGVVAGQVASRQVAGAVVTVVADGRVLFTRGYGFANVANQVPVDGERTLFRPGSVSKLFTWVALMQQIESGKVDLDADVNRYLDFKIPDFKGAPIRVRDLMAHSPGMSDVGGFLFDSPDKNVPYQQWIKAHIPQRLWAPGTEIAYSNYGAALAGYIVERVSGETYADYVERHIFTPLGMSSTTFREPQPAALTARLADGHKLVDGQLVPKLREYLSSIMPAGSASASAPDMARFMLALLGNGALGGKRILRPESVALLESDLQANVPGLPGMAHGFLVEREAGPRMVGHAGNTVDFHSDLVIAPERGIGFFISFTGGADSGIARTELRNALIGRLFPQARAPRYAGSSQPQLGAYRANRRDYSATPDPKDDIKVEGSGDHIVTVTTAGRKVAFEQIGPNEYEEITGTGAGGPYDRIKFYGDAQDPRLSFASMPYETFHLVKP